MSGNHFITDASTDIKQGNISDAFATGVNNLPAAETSMLCYLDLSINEMNYHFNSRSGLILYNENENATIYFENEAATKFGWLNFKNQIPDKADSIEFFEPASDTYLILFKKSNSVYPVALTNYSNTSEFITGQYSGIYTDAKDNPVYNVTCKFNILRHAIRVRVLNAE